MTIKKKKSSDKQHTLFDFIKKAEELTRQSDDPAPGSLAIRKEYKAALAEDIKHATDESGCELSRHEVAGRMSKYLGETVTKEQLDNWTAPSHPHSMWGDYVPAFVLATGGQRRAVEVLSRHSRLFMLPSEEALRAEIQKFDEEMKRIKAEKLKRQLYLKELNGGRR